EGHVNLLGIESFVEALMKLPDGRVKCHRSRLAVRGRDGGCYTSRMSDEPNAAVRVVTLTPRRRWFRWSLRTMFVVLTAFCLWLGWNVNAVQQRKRLMDWAAIHGIKLNQDGTWDRVSPAMIARMKTSRHRPAAITRRLPQAAGIGWFRQSVLGDHAIE